MMFHRFTQHPWAHCCPLARWFGLAWLAGAGACSKPNKTPAAPGPSTAAANQAFLLREVYSGRYCFRTRFYWRDSARNRREVCQVRRRLWDSVNRVQVDLHGWQGRDCDTNEFCVLRQANRAWFVPFCDERNFRGERSRPDTGFFKTSLSLTAPLNSALRGLRLSDRPRFVATLLDGLFSPQGRLTPRTCAALLIPRTRAYLRPRLAQPNHYYYHRLRYGQTETVWEFDDTHADGLRVRVISPGLYTCMAM